MDSISFTTKRGLALLRQLAHRVDNGTFMLEYVKMLVQSEDNIELKKKVADLLEVQNIIFKEEWSGERDYFTIYNSYKNLKRNIKG